MPACVYHKRRARYRRRRPRSCGVASSVVAANAARGPRARGGCRYGSPLSYEEGGARIQFDGWAQRSAAQPRTRETPVTQQISARRTAPPSRSIGARSGPSARGRNQNAWRVPNRNCTPLASTSSIALRDREVRDRRIEPHEVVHARDADADADREVARAIERAAPVLDPARVDEEPQLAVAEGHPVEEIVIDLGIDRLAELDAGERDVLAEALVDRAPRARRDRRRARSGPDWAPGSSRPAR